MRASLSTYYKPSNNDYDNDWSDNCDYNFGTFDNFGVKNDKKVSHNMILMSKYKGQHGGEKGKKIRARPSPPPFSGNAQKKLIFLMWRLPLWTWKLWLCFSCYVCAAVWTNCGHRVGPEKDPVQLFKIKSKGGNWWWLPWWLQCIAMVTKCFFRNLEIEVTLALPDLSEGPSLVQGAETLISDNKRLKKSHIIVREG